MVTAIDGKTKYTPFHIENVDEAAMVYREIAEDQGKTIEVEVHPDGETCRIKVFEKARKSRRAPDGRKFIGFI